MLNRRYLSVAVVLFATFCPASERKLARDYNVKPVPFSKVKVEDDFWTPRLEVNQKITIGYAFKKCEETDRIGNFEKAAGLKQSELGEALGIGQTEVSRMLNARDNMKLQLCINFILTVSERTGVDPEYLFRGGYAGGDIPPSIQDCIEKLLLFPPEERLIVLDHALRLMEDLNRIKALRRDAHDPGIPSAEVQSLP